MGWSETSRSRLGRIGISAITFVLAGCAPESESADAPGSDRRAESAESADPADGVRGFRPYDAPALTLINGVQFTPGGGSVIFTLLQPEYVEYSGGNPAEVIGEVGLFTAQPTEAGWTDPEQLPFSGVYHDYEPALSPDGRWLVFNSRRPDADGVIPELNDLWIVEHSGAAGTDEWMVPRRVDELSTLADEESYATISASGLMVFHKRTEVNGAPQSDLWTATLDDTGHFGPARRLEKVSSALGEGDPQISPDGSFLMFTRWDEDLGWAESCDIYISFRTAQGWSEPLAFQELNSPGADYAPALSADGQTIYSRVGGPYAQRPFAPLLDAARRRAGI